MIILNLREVAVAQGPAFARMSSTVALIPIPTQALPLLAALSASSAYYQYASGASALPPRHHLDLE